MPRFLIRIVLLLVLFPGVIKLPSKITQAYNVETWQPVSPGIAYREFHLDHPNRVYVARMDRHAVSVTLDTAIAQGNFSDGLQTVSEMANRYDQTIAYWGREWGVLSKVVVAINGFFYDTETGIPWSGQVTSGWYAKHFDERQSGSSLVWTFDGDIFMGECIVHPPARQVIHFSATGQSLLFDSINSAVGPNSLVIYTPQYGGSTPPGDDKVEVLVRLERPLMIMPDPAVITGVIVEVRVEQNSSPIPFDQIVLSASGQQQEELLQLAEVGEEIGISQELKHYLSNCKTPSSVNWENVYAATGASFVFLKAGKVQALSRDLGSVLRSPRTAIAYNDRYVFFMVVDGRDRFRSLGMSMAELGVFAKMTLGADWGTAMDGGGSSTMVVNGRVVNHPLTVMQEGASREFPRASSSKLLLKWDRPLDRNNPWLRISPPLFISETYQVQEGERAVANAWMMVSIEPGQRSARYQSMQPVAVSAPQGLLLRLGPGDNYPQISVLSYQSEGSILDHPLNGIFARDAYWWNVQFGDLQGWVAESGIR